MYRYNLDSDEDSSSESQEFWNDPEFFGSSEVEFKPLREKNSSGKSVYKHVPHKEKAPQVVARRNARERRRVQAVNNAFVKLRNAVPIQNSRGKRISKVKTLLCAIEYIRSLDSILQKYSSCTDFYGNLGISYELNKISSYPHPEEGNYEKITVKY